MSFFGTKTSFSHRIENWFRFWAPSELLRLSLASHSSFPQQMAWAWLDKYCDGSLCHIRRKEPFQETVIDDAKITACLNML